MNHIRLLIRNQCGSHIIHGMPNSLAFQQNYYRYDGPSESGSFFLRRTRPNVLSPKIGKTKIVVRGCACVKVRMRKEMEKAACIWLI